MRFTLRAQQAVLRAQEEVVRLKHSSVEPWHLLLGVLAVPGDPGSEILRKAGVGAADVAAEVEALAREGSPLPSGEVPFSPKAKDVLEESVDAAYKLGDGHVGTEHLLAGVVSVLWRAASGPGFAALSKAGLDSKGVLAAIRESRGEAGEAAGEEPEAAPAGGRPGWADALVLEGIVCMVRLGASEDERSSRQEVLLDLELRLDLSKAARSGEPRDSLDYAALEAKVRELAETNDFKLLERLAGEAARAALEADPRIRSVTASAHAKPVSMPRTGRVTARVVRRREPAAPGQAGAQEGTAPDIPAP